MQNVQQLSLVLVETLYLNIEDGTGIHFNSVVLKNIVCKANLVLVLDLHEFTLCLLILRIGLKLCDMGKIRDPLIPDMLRNPGSKKRVCVQKEAALCDSVGLIVELLREHLIEIMKRFILQNFRMKSCHTVYREAGNNCHVRHADLAIINDSHFGNLIADIHTGIVVLRMDFSLKAAVDFLHDLVDAGKQAGKQLDRPFLQCLSHNRVVRVGRALLHNRPCIIPLKTIFIQKNPHQLRNRQSRMRVVHLEYRLLGKIMDVLVAGHELLDCQLNRGRYEEILLLQAKLLALHMIIAGIQNLTDGSRQIFLLHSLLVIAFIEGIQMEAVHRLCVPDPESVHKSVSVSDNRHVVRNRLYGRIAFLAEHGAPVLSGISGNVSAKMNLLRIFRTAKLKRISVLQPVVRSFHLITVYNFLFEHTVAVPDAAAICRIIQRCKGIQEAGSKSSKAAVSKCRIRLLVLDGIDVKAKFIQCFSNRFIRLQIDQIVAEGSSHQKFHGKIVQGLRIFLLKLLLRPHPVIYDLVLQCIGGSLEHLLFGCFSHLAAIHRSNIIFNASLKQFLVKAELLFLNHFLLLLSL